MTLRCWRVAPRLGYIGDITKVKERTMMMAILASLGLVLMPLGDFVGGQIYKLRPHIDKVKMGMWLIWITLEKK